MATKLTSYLNFRDGCRDAMEFYRSVFGGELTVSTFGETWGDSFGMCTDRFGVAWMVNIAGA